VGVESTVLDLTSTPPTLLRPGLVTQEMIEKVIGPIVRHQQQKGKRNGDRQKINQLPFKRFH
jgi:L-threonylcarbamoyladenylate synthase